MTESRKLDVLEPHIRTEPRRPISRVALVAFRRTCRLKRGPCREVRFADESRIVAVPREGPCEAGGAHPRIEVDAVIPYAVRQRKLSRQNRSSRRLAHEVRSNA